MSTVPVVPDSEPRIRRSPIPTEGVYIVRGDRLDPTLLRRDAERFHQRFSTWGRYGVSAFYAAGRAEIDALCETRLIQFPTIIVFARSDLIHVGVEVVPTFRTPHVTLAHADLLRLIELLRCTRHVERHNPYYESE